MAKPGDAIAFKFPTRNPSTGAALNADSLPTGAMVKNGVDDGAVTVTVTNIATGEYKAAATIPGTYSAGDYVQVKIAATVLAIAGVSFTNYGAMEKRVDDIVDSNNRVDISKWLGSAVNALQAGRVDAYLGAAAAAVVQSFWDVLLTAQTVAGSVGKKFKDWVLGSDNKGMISTDALGAISFNNTGQTTNYPALLAAAQTLYAPAKAGDAMALTPAERIAMATAVELRILDDTDGDAVLQAIVNKINSVDADLSGLSIVAISDRIERAGGPLKLIQAKTDNLPADTNALLTATGIVLTAAERAAITAQVERTGGILQIMSSSGVILAAAQTLYAPAKAGNAMTLTAGERTAIANEVESQIIDDTDSERVLQAIVDKIAAVNPSLDDLTLGAIASSVRDEIERNGGMLYGVAGVASAYGSMIQLSGSNYVYKLSAYENMPTSGGGGGGATVEEIDDQLSATHGGGLWTGTQIQTTPAGDPPVVLSGVDLFARQSESFATPAITITGESSTGWTRFEFTVKREFSDKDSDALLEIRVSNPPDVDDGLILKSGKATEFDWGSLLVIDDAPDTIFQALIDSRGMNIAPGASVWEFKRYSTAGSAKSLAVGTLDIQPAVRRNPL